MAGATTLFGSIADSTNGSSFNMGAATPVANSLLTVIARCSAGTALVISGGGLTWTKQLQAGSPNGYCVYTAPIGGSPGSVTVNVACTGTATGCSSVAFQTTGYNTANPLAQVPVFASGSTGTAPAVTLGASRSTNNTTLGYAGNLINPAAITEPGGWTEIVDTGFNTPTTGLEGAYRDTGETNATVTWGATTASAWIAIVVEVACPVNNTLSCAVGSYTYSGNAITVPVARNLSAATGVYAYAGNALSVPVSRQLALDAGNYAYSGIPINYQVTSVSNTGGDDAFHPLKHTGWDKKAWKKKQNQDLVLTETIEFAYKQIHGLLPEPEVVEEIREEVRKELPQIQFADTHGLENWIAEAQSVINRIIEYQAMIDEEETILMLLQ